MPDPTALPFHLKQLQTLCTRHPLAPKVVYVRTRRIGQSLRMALGRAGCSHVNLRLRTLKDEAGRLAEPLLLQEGREKLGRDARLLWMEAFVRAQEAALSVPPAALARAAGRTINAVRMAGLTPEDLAADGERRLARLLEAYTALLEEKRYYDEPLLYQRAAALLERRPEAASLQRHFIFDEVELSGLRLRFAEVLEEARGRSLVRLGRPRAAEEPAFAHAAAGRLPDRDRLESRTRVPVGAGIALWDRNGDTLETCGEVETLETTGRSGEVEAVLRRLQHEEIAYDQVEIAYTAESPYLSLLFSLLACHAVPATFSGGVPVLLTRPGQALAKFLDWIESGFAAAELERLLASGTLKLGEGLSADRIMALLQEGQVRAGKDSYFRALERLEEEHPEEEHPEEDLEPVRSFLNRLFVVVPKKEASPTTFTERCIAFLDRFVPKELREEALKDVQGDARETLVSRLRDLDQQLPAEEALPLSRAQLLHHVQHLLGEHKVADEVPTPGKVHVAPLDAAGYSGRRHLFVLGLDQKSFPGGDAQDPLLVDAKREALSGELALERWRPAEANAELARLLSMATGRVALLCAHYDVATGQTLYPSAAFLRAATRFGDEERLPEPLVPKAEAGAPPDRLARETLSESEAWLALRDEGALQPLIEARKQWLRRGREAEEARAAPQITAFDGALDSEDVPSPFERILSASRLEALAACPYRYFLHYVLRARPPEELPEDEEGWLDHRSYGSLLHEVLERFMGELMARGEAPSFERHEPLLMEHVEEVLDETAEVFPPPSPSERAADAKRLRRAARIFLRAEAERAGEGAPYGLEVSFGYGEDEDPPGQPDPVEIRLTDEVAFRLRGRIDRADERPDGMLEIWDYKSGSASPYSAGDLSSEGKKLQWALYAHALSELTGRPVARSGYFFVSERELGLRMADGPPPREALLDWLGPPFTLADAGLFLPTPSKDTCRYCDFRPVCGDTDARETEIERKVESEDLSEREAELVAHLR